MVQNIFIQIAIHKGDMNVPLSRARKPSSVSSDDDFLAFTANLC
jgi:hypothetical protein